MAWVFETWGMGENMTTIKEIEEWLENEAKAPFLRFGEYSPERRTFIIHAPSAIRALAHEAPEVKE